MKNIFLLLIVFSLSNIVSQTSNDYCKMAYDSLQKKNFLEAHEYYKKATEIDPNNADAYYDMACVAAYIGSHYNEISGINDYVGDIFLRSAPWQLQKAIKLNEGYIAKALSDHDLDPLKSLYSYYYVLKYSVTSVNDLYEILVNVKIWQLAFPGILGWRYKITFNEDLKFKLERNENTILSEETKGISNIADGYYQIKTVNNNVIITLFLAKPLDGQYTIELQMQSEGGKLLFKNNIFEKLDPLYMDYLKKQKMNYQDFFIPNYRYEA